MNASNPSQIWLTLNKVGLTRPRSLNSTKFFDTIIPTLTKIYNNDVQTSTYPKNWKSAFIIPQPEITMQMIVQVVN